MRFAATLVLIALAGTAMAQDHMRSGYIRRDGVYVPPSYATNPNDTRLDNYSTKGNVNPYTGKKGTVDPYKLDDDDDVSQPSLYGNTGKRRRY